MALSYQEARPIFALYCVINDQKELVGVASTKDNLFRMIANAIHTRSRIMTYGHPEVWTVQQINDLRRDKLDVANITLDDINNKLCFGRVEFLRDTEGWLTPQTDGRLNAKGPVVTACRTAIQRVKHHQANLEDYGLGPDKPQPPTS